MIKRKLHLDKETVTENKRVSDGELCMSQHVVLLHGLVQEQDAIGLRSNGRSRAHAHGRSLHAESSGCVLAEKQLDGRLCQAQPGKAERSTGDKVRQKMVA